MTPPPRPAPSAGCLFSGMGGFASGLAEAGFQIRWASDHNPSACTVFRHRFPDVPVIERDARALSVANGPLEPVDVLAAGFPCQSFSQAGDRRGFDDQRGEVFFEIPRLLEEWQPQQRPKLLILENVPHLLYGGDGWWFDQIRRSLRRAGYWFRRESCWLANVKQDTDLPQDRERLFMVAASRAHFSYNPFLPPPPPPRTNVLTRNIEQIVDRSVRGDALDYLPDGNRYRRMIEKQIESGQSPANLYQVRRSYVREKRDGLCPTLTANMGVGGHNVPFLRDRWGIRRLSVAEVARLQGFEEPAALFPAIPQAEQYRLLGNAVCPKLARQVGARCAKILQEECK